MTGREILDKMIKTNEKLYTKILDTPGFAYYFNELAKKALGKKGEETALDLAIQIIESYKLCILNSKEEIGIDLKKKGFCQGSVFKNAFRDIEKKRKEE